MKEICVMGKTKVKAIPMNKNRTFQSKVKQLPRYKDTNLPDPAAFVDLMLEAYPDLFEALRKK